MKNHSLKPVAGRIVFTCRQPMSAASPARSLAGFRALSFAPTRPARPLFRIAVALFLSLAVSDMTAAPHTRVLQPFVDNHTIAGAVTLVARGEQTLSLDAVGWADLAKKAPMRADCLFWIASMTKPMTASALFMLQDEGLLNVNDPVEKYLPEFNDQWLVESKTATKMTLVRPARSVLIRDLLTHTSGLGDVDPPRSDTTLAELAMGYAHEPLQFEPGSHWTYANQGLNTAGRIVEVVSGRPYAEFMEQRIFRPLGMKDTTFWPSPAQEKRLAKSYEPAPDGQGLRETGIRMLKANGKSMTGNARRFHRADCSRPRPMWRGFTR